MDEYGQYPTIICNLQDEEHSFAMYMYQPLPTEDLSEVGKQTKLGPAQPQLVQKFVDEADYSF